MVPVVMVVPVVPVMPMAMVPVVPMVMAPVVMPPVVVVMPADLYGLQAVDLILTNHGGLGAVGAQRHQGLLG
jgi:hypothetical protein